MNEEKLFGLQMQVRQNQQELMDYVKELDGWGEDMKQKEEQLKRETQSSSEVSLTLVSLYVWLVSIFAVMLQVWYSRV